MRLIKSIFITTICSTLLGVVSAQPTFEQKRELRADTKERLAANKPIAFYGKVVDQFNEPVQGIRVVLTTLSWFDPSGKGEDWDQQEDDHTLITDTGGRIDFRGGKGTSISVELQPKAGYLYGEYPFSHLGIKRDFNYSFNPAWDHPTNSPIHQADPARPVIFRVWKIQGGETVVKWGPGKAVRQDGTFVAVDLLEREFRSEESPMADFRVALNAEIPAGARADYKCRWSVQIEAINGGLVLTDDEYMYLAPDAGYQPAIALTFDPADADWERTKTFKFYLRSDGGKHCARVVLTAGPRPDLDTGLISFSSVINLTGSRNLEEGKALPYLSNTR